MKQRIISNVLILLPLVVALSGCKYKTYQTLPAEIPQGKAVALHEHQILTTHLQTVRVYDQFATLAFFDTLFLAEPLRRLQTESLALRTGKDREEIWKEHTEQMKESIVFCILSDVRVAEHASLADALCLWSLQLVNARHEALFPAAIHEQELTPEFISFFDTRLTNHKTPYAVKFPAKDKNGEPFIRSGEGVTLRFCSVKKVAEIHWPRVGSVEKCDRPLVTTQANKARRYDSENRYWL